MGESKEAHPGRELEEFIQEVEKLAQEPATDGLALKIVTPGQPERALPHAALSRTSAELAGLTRAAELREERVARARVLSVLPEEVVARRDDAADRTVTLGAQVRSDEDGCCRARRYGYLSLLDARLDVVSPLWMDPEALRVYWLLLDSRARPVTGDMIRTSLQDLGVVEGIKEERIAQLTEQVRAGTHKRGAFLVATGTAPVPGRDARIEFLVQTERQVGEEQPDGSMDFREINYIPAVREGQLLARRHPALVGTPGRDVRGRALPAPQGRDDILEAGDNVRVEVRDGVELFSATISGGVRLTAGELSVSRLLQIEGNVSFDTGNLDFGGEIVIRGSVLQAFSVKAASHVTVGGTVESGAAIHSGGDVIVVGGILGRKTRVEAKGKVHAAFVQEATLRAGGDIQLNRFSYQAQLRAGGHVRIFKGGQQRGGSILGGQAWAREGIDLYVAGSSAHVETLLGAGIDPEQVRKLDHLNRRIDTTHSLFRRLLTRFDLGHFDLTQIRNMIAATSGPRRKLLATTARRLGEVAQVYQQLLSQRKALEKEIAGSEDPAEIRVREKAHPGVVIQLGEHRRKLIREITSPRFHLEDGKLMER